MVEHWQTIIYMVRHGETDLDYSRNPEQDGHRRLTTLGKKQIEKVGEYLAGFQPKALYSSPMIRCQETAEIINRQLDQPLKIQTTDQLSEIYLAEARAEAGERGESIFKTILKDHIGEQVVAVSHQYIIGYAVADFLKVGYHDVPCDFGDIYRFVFADQKLVEATQLQPAKNLLNQT